MDTVYVFLAEGFEEIEAVTPIDLLRRAGANVCTVGIAGKRVVGTHGVPFEADVEGTHFTLPQDAAMVVLPGGGKGTENMLASEMIAGVLRQAAERNLYVAAICAAPLVLHQAGLLQGKQVTAFPDVQPRLTEAHVTGTAVEADGKVITGRSAGVARQFAHRLIAELLGWQTADQVVAQIYPEE